METARLPSGREITDCCGEGCEECTVCRYTSWLDDVQQCAPPGAKIERDAELEWYMDYKQRSPDDGHARTD